MRRAAVICDAVWGDVALPKASVWGVTTESKEVGRLAGVHLARILLAVWGGGDVPFSKGVHSNAAGIPIGGAGCGGGSVSEGAHYLGAGDSLSRWGVGGGYVSAAGCGVWNQRFGAWWCFRKRRGWIRRTAVIPLAMRSRSGGGFADAMVGQIYYQNYG